MSERYSKLFSLPENLYAEGSPVIVSAGNLLKDNQTSKVLAQLKIKNISPKPIKAATVLVHVQDTTGKTIDGDTEQEYLDLSVKQGEEFGQKVAIPLTNASTRGISIEVRQVVFTDNSIWEGNDAPWEPLLAAESLSHKFGDAELVKQYRLQHGDRCEVIPAEHKDLWLCACGAWNRDATCWSCGKSKAALLALDLNALKADRDARLAREKTDREAKEAADKAAAEARSKKTKKLFSVLIPVVAVCVAGLLIVTKVVIPSSNYNKAIALIDAGQYEEAIAAFEALGDYKDSPEQAAAARKAEAEEKRLAVIAQIEAEKAAAYAAAEALLANGNYAEAYRGFLALGSYKDSASRAEMIKSEHYADVVSVGETIVFGSYEQDNNLSNGKEGIEWIVLHKENSRVLVVSKRILDHYKYNDSLSYVTWENCSLRKWLNETFLQTAFSSSEQKKIPTVTVRADKNPYHSTNSGNDTQDKVFLLSITEANTYFPDKKSASASLTAYAKGRDDWWLRTPGESNKRAVRVLSGGLVAENGAEVTILLGIRPAIWIDLG